MKVVSLFDGISCGRVALERAGIKVSKYYAFEIDKNAIMVSANNYSDIVQCGNVLDADFISFKNIDLLMGGSPCQDLCSMGSRKGLNGEKSKLFFEFIRALKEIRPKYFLFENNASMTQENKDIISRYIGCEPTMINSADFSAQNRKRLYWTNIPITPYIPKNITITDILDDRESREDVTEKVFKYVFSGEYNGRKIEKTTRQSIRDIKDKTRTICTNSYDISSNSGLCFKIGERYYKPNQIEFERLQTLPDLYTHCLPIKKAVFAIGNGWTVDVIAHIFKGLVEQQINDEE